MEGAAYVYNYGEPKKDFMKDISLEELLEAGAHFGHQVTRHNPKARDFVFEARDNIHIIDLAKTKEGLEKAGEFVRSVASTEGSTLVIVGTKRQAQPIVQEALAAFENSADSVFSVTNRWIGGTLTNFSEVSKNYKKLHDFEDRLRDEEEKAKYTKKEIGGWEKQLQKLMTLYGGIADMKAKPSLLFIIDAHLEELAVREARDMHVPTVAIVDTNADPSSVTYPIPANDDATGSIKLITEYILEAWSEGKKNAESKVGNSEVKTTETPAKKEKKETPKKKTVKKKKTEEKVA